MHRERHPSTCALPTGRLVVLVVREPVEALLAEALEERLELRREAAKALDQRSNGHAAVALRACVVAAHGLDVARSKLLI